MGRASKGSYGSSAMANFNKVAKSMKEKKEMMAKKMPAKNEGSAWASKWNDRYQSINK